MKKLLFIIISCLSINLYAQKDTIVKPVLDSISITKHVISRRLLCSVDSYDVKHIVNDTVISEIIYVAYSQPKYYFWKKKSKF